MASYDSTLRCGIGAWFDSIPLEELASIPTVVKRFDQVVNQSISILILMEFDRGVMDFQDVGDVVSTMLGQYLEREGEL